MAKYMLVSFKTCPWVQRSAILLREKNDAFEFRHIESDNRPDWFLAISPHKKVPTLTIDDGVTLFESNAINEYLDEMVARSCTRPTRSSARSTGPGPITCRPSPETTGCAYAATGGLRGGDRQDPGYVRSHREGARKAGQRPVLQRQGIFAGRCGLCAVPAALRLPRPHQKDRHDGEVSAAEGVVRRADGAAFDALVPRGEFEAMYREGLRKRGSYLSQFVEAPRAAAE